MGSHFPEGGPALREGRGRLGVLQLGRQEDAPQAAVQGQLRVLPHADHGRRSEHDLDVSWYHRLR